MCSCGELSRWKGFVPPLFFGCEIEAPDQFWLELSFDGTFSIDQEPGIYCWIFRCFIVCSYATTKLLFLIILIL